MATADISVMAMFYGLSITSHTMTFGNAILRREII